MLGASPQIRDAHLRALQGALLAAGTRLAPTALASVADSLKEAIKAAPRPGGACDDDAYRVALGCAAGAIGVCEQAEVVQGVLVAGPLAPGGQSIIPSQRHLNGIILASMALHAGPQLETMGLLKPFLEAVGKAARDESVPVRVAAARAAGRLASRCTAALPHCITVLQALLGQDQNTETQRNALLAARRLATELASKGQFTAQFEPQLPALLPPICAIILAAGTSGGSIVRTTAEASLQKVLQVEGGLEVAQRALSATPGPMVRQTLTDSFLRRLQKLTDDNLFDMEEY